MLVMILKAAITLIVVHTWLRGREPLDAATARARLKLALALAVAQLGALQVAGTASAGAQGFTTLAAALLGVALLLPLAQLSLAGPYRRGARTYRALLLLPGLITLWAGSTDGAAVLFILAMLRHPWLSVLTTGERFRVAGVCLLLTLYAWFGVREPQGLLGATHELHGMGWMMRSVLMLLTGFGVLRAFKAFSTDPTLGIRRVSLRLTLSHVLVVLVPALLIVALWISSTYLGVNADRALVAGRALEREAASLEAHARDLLAVAGAPEAAAGALEREYRRQWPSLRAFALADRGVRALAGDSSGAAALAGWVAQLDSLPSRGVVEWGGQRWLGAAAGAPARGLVALVPIGTVLDSTLSPLMGARVSMRAAASRFRDADSLRAAGRALRDSLDAARAAGSSGDSAALERTRRMTRRFGIPDSVVTSGGRGPVVVSTGDDTLSSAEGEIGFTGQVNVPGVRLRNGEWGTHAFTLTARASFRATLAGLFEKVRENPLQAIPIASLAGLALLLIPIAVTNLRMVTGMGGSITRGIAALRDGARAFGEGKLAHRIPIEGDDDLWDTARQFNQMAEGLERARELEKERDRLENELELARRIQARLLPASAPRIAGLDVAGLSESAREVGGDYYDHLDLGGGRVLLVIADVSGKGVPAALLMSGFRASLMSQDTQSVPPDVVASRLNEFLHRSVEPGRFVTAFLGFLDAESGRFVFVNAGHNPPLLLRADGRTEWLQEGGLILGIMAGSPFSSGETTLEPGDRLALYTDGVTEGADAANEQWGEERLVASLKRAGSESAAATASRIVREVRTFEGESGPADDITVLVARRV